MANRDGTGPQGQGPLTGAKMGPCQKDDIKGKNIPFDQGSGNLGCGGRRGLGNRWRHLKKGQKGFNSSQD